MNTNPSPAEPHNEGPENQGPDSLRDDAMLDLLLQEALGGPTPPDQTGLILQRLADEEEGSHTKRTGSKTGSVSATSQSSKYTSKLSIVTLLIGTAAALLLSVGIAVGLKYRSDLALQARSDEAAQNAPSVPGPTAIVENEGNDASPQPKSTPRQRPQPIELAGNPSNNNADELGSSTNASPESLDQLTIPRDRNSGSPAPITLVSKTVDSRWQSHWKRLGINPTPSRDKDSIRRELSDRLGIEVPVEAIGDSAAIQVALQKPSNRQAISNRLLASFLGKSSQNENATKSLSEVLKTGTGADRLIASWMRPSQTTPKAGDQASASKIPAATPWIRMLQPADLHEVTVKTAALTNHQDLRCQRCHDVPNAGDEVPTQADYWSVAAGLAPLLNPSRAGKDLFYDTLDGRRQLASPPTEEQSQAWSEGLIGSRELAEGIVSTLFTMVHDSPSTTSPFDLSVASAASVPPETLRPLVDDLIASDFDVLRCLSILLSDAVMTRSVPEAMSAQGILVADDEQWSNAVAAVHAMAARSPFRRPDSAQHRLQVAQLDAKPNWPAGSGRDALLAQPLGSEMATDGSPSDSGDRRPDKNRDRKTVVASTGYPMRSSMIVPGWISRLPDFDSRLDHVAHLAGQLKLNTAQRELAHQALASGDDEALIFERLWWIIRPNS
ncbi:hypothetical protein RBSH_00399 [Rhodopirellula baltica SH28]|uniref:Uncharacterized protein n=1 Tax=Rhodopirellula baltica SH28 TaxID=993517 RepID=K5DMU8_RHOBT|nr:hypothetical protein [Rhodopirellula baltica]EKK04204.1 hypothetical protein RBSH_00399 [Rhodopirellula baltica SH28]